MGKLGKEGKRVKLTPVESSMLQAVGYDPETQTLEVLFNSGERYQYFDVPPEEYEGLMAAESKGRYMQSNIIDMYDWTQIKRWQRRKR
jgi:hypothetical protein